MNDGNDFLNMIQLQGAALAGKVRCDRWECVSVYALSAFYHSVY